MKSDDLNLLILHGLRLTGMASAEEVAAVHGLDPDVVDQLRLLDADGLVTPVRGDPARWTLTSEGRQHGERLLARELDGVVTAGGGSGRRAVAAAYHRFVDLNQPMLGICTRWQIISQDPIVLNDHSDSEHDAAVIAEVHEINERVRPVCVDLETVLERFRRYRPGFDEALFRLDRGESDWLTKPTVLSYHTVWFQLHEDLLATLGLERAAETARLNSKPTTEPPETTPGPTGIVR